MPIKRWKGPEDWTGYAVDGWRKFPFHLLPWLTLETKRGKQGNCSLIKASDSRRVFRIDPVPASSAAEIIEVSDPVFAKRYLLNNLRRKMGRLLAGSRAEREFRLGHAMIHVGIPTPEPLACAENVHASIVQHLDRKIKLPAASYLLTRAWENDGCVPYYIWKRRESAVPLARILARFLAYLHASGFYHDDCSSEHFLVAQHVNLDCILSETDQAWTYSPEHSPLAVIDIDNGSLSRKPVDLNHRLINLSQVIRSTSRAFPSKVRMRFVEEYLKAANLNFEITTEDAVKAIERIGWRKSGRNIMQK